MSLKPLDLQNLFVRLNQVSKQQAAQQEAPLHAQQVAAQEIEQEAKLADKRVGKTNETGIGAEKMHDDQSGNGGSSSSDREKRRDGDESVDKREEDIFKDPDLGNRIDISG